MRNTGITIVLAIALCFLQNVSSAQLPAFPGAEGAGMYTTGGRGTATTPSTVFEVTHLIDDGLPGSLRYALTATAAYRTVVFRVAGTIHLNSGLNIPANTTIAGQTAPGDGICVADHPVYIKGDNVIVRYMRFRLGDKNQKKVDANGNPVDGSGGDDAFGGTGPSHIIIDHCSVSWSADEALTIYRGDNLTIQWCMVYEPLNYSYHFEAGDTDYQRHGYGGIWGGKRASLHHNLIAHCRNRTPRFAGISTYTPNTLGVENVDFRNNVIYNWGINNVYGGEGGNYNVVNNYYKYGPNTGSGVRYRICNPSNGATVPFGKWYVNGNYVEGSAANTADNWSGVAISDASLAMATTAHNHGYLVKTQTAADAFTSVLAGAGCVLPNRDTLDQRIVNDVKNRTGSIIDVQGGYPHGTPYEQTVNAWPALASGTAPADSDHDGMPDHWESANGLNPNNATDRSVIAANGYTNLENYLNSLTNPEVSTDPVLHATASFSSFKQLAGTPSPIQTFPVSGQNLMGVITLTAPAHFQLSTDGTTWSSSLTFTPVGGTVASTTVSVRLHAATAGNYGGVIEVASTGTPTLTFPVNGSTADPAPPRQKQTIGLFPLMEGGFENQDPGNVSTSAPGSGVNLSQTVWTTSGNGEIKNNGTARTGNHFFTYTSTSGSTKNVYSPTVSGSIFTNNTKYIVQYYYRAPAPATGNSVGGLLAVADNTSFTQAHSAVAYTGTNSGWVKAAFSYSVNPAYSPTLAFGGLRFNGGGSAIVKPYDVDDFVVYPADNQSSPAADITPPDAATGATATGNYDNGTISVEWTAPATGVDGGGYVVARSTSATAPALNPNGLYSLGNAIGTEAVMVYIGKGAGFIDDGSVAAIVSGTTYYYHVYTTDKAFNYSAANTASGAVTVPVASVSLAGTLNAFSQTVGTPSASQRFTVTGSNLSGKVNVTAPAGFELSEDDDSWSSSLLLNPEIKSLNTMGYLRLNAGAAGHYSGSLSAASAGATAATLAITGTARVVYQVQVYTAANADVVVAKDGSGQYTSIQAAINAAPAGRTTPYIIYIKNGKYLEKVNIPSNKPFIHLIGESVANTVISWDSYSGKVENGVNIGTNTSATLTVSANDFFMMSVTVENATGYVGDGPQAVAIYMTGDRCVYKNCRFISGQDTVWHNGSGRHLFKNCYIDGNTDFIFGSSTALFDSCVIYGRDRIDGGGGGYVTAANTTSSLAYGEVFRDCQMPSNRGVTTYSLGRPWGNAPKTVYLNTKMGSSVSPAGWSTWAVDISQITYAEYKSKKWDGSPVDVSKRLSWSKQLTDEQAAAYYNNQNLFGNWDPNYSFPALNGTVPVELSVANFRTQRNSSNILLSWNLCWPLSGVHFELFRSTDSVHFTKVTELTGGADSVVAFSLTDALPAKGTVYYYFVKASKEGYASNSSYVAFIDPSIPLNGDFRSRASGGWTNNTTAFSTIAGGSVTGVTITASNRGYTNPPAVTFGVAPTGGVTATGTAIVIDGIVAGVNITNPGSGYATAPSVTFSTGGVSAHSVWERYNAGTKAWEAVALGTGATGNVTVSSGDTVILNSLVGINNLSIEKDGIFQADVQGKNLRIKGDINNAGIFGGTNPASNKITLELDGINGAYSINGDGLYNFSGVRALTGVSNITLNVNADMVLSGGLQAWYGSNNSTWDYGTNDVTITIKPGVTVKAGYLHSSSTNELVVKTVGKYTYNVGGTLDLSASTLLSALVPHKTIAQPITLNVTGTLKLGRQFSTNLTPVAGSLFLNIGEGGLVDATKATTFTVHSNYFAVSGNGALKRTVGTTATLFPVGTAGSYNPVTLTNTGISDNFSVSVKKSFDTPLTDAAKVVNRQWTIGEDVEGGSNVIAQFAWTSADQGASFDPSGLLAVMRSVDGDWKYSAATPGGSGTIAAPYTATVTGFTEFSSFGVTNYVKVPATIKLADASFVYDGKPHVASGFAFGAGGEAEQLVPALTFTYKDAYNTTWQGPPVNAGTYSVTASFGGNDFYLPSSATAVLVINPRPLTIKADDQSKECGNVLQLGSTAFSADGLVEGDGVSTVSLSSDGAGANGKDGSYAIAAADAQGTGLSNYTITYETGTLLVEDKTKPIPDVAELPELTGECSVVAVHPTASDACAGTLTATTTEPLSYNQQGAYIISWKYDDGNGNVTTQTQKITVKDVTAPVIEHCPEVAVQCFEAGGTYNIPMLKATDNCGTVNISYTISGATSRSGSGPDASGSFNTGTSTINWLVTDGHGNQTSCQTTVIVNSSMSVSIPDVYAVDSQVDLKNTLYIGYGPTSLTLSPVSSGGASPYTYLWNNGATTPTTSVSAAGVYSVRIQDVNHCSASASITIKTLDVQCGNDNNKVMICHNNKEICVASGAVQEHLSHGDHLGGCSATTSTGSNNVHIAGLNNSDGGSGYQVALYPNPVGETLNVKVSDLRAGAVVQIYNTLGAVVRTERLGNTTHSLALGGLTTGMYHLVIRNGSRVTTHKIIKQ